MQATNLTRPMSHLWTVAQTTLRKENPCSVTSTVSKILSRKFSINPQENTLRMLSVPVPLYAKKLASPVLTRIDLSELPKRSGYETHLKAIALDSSGTVQDSGVLSVIHAFQKVFKDIARVEVTQEEVARSMGKRKDLHLQEILSYESVQERWKMVHGNYPTKDDGTKIFKYFPKIQLDILSEQRYQEPITGLEETIENVRSLGIKTFSTTGFLSGIDIFLWQAMSGVYAPSYPCDAEQTQTGRPTAEMILLGLSKTNTAPSQAIKVGDTCGDVAEGLNAHTWTVALSLTSVYVQKSEEELKQLDAKTLEKLNSQSVATLAKEQPHYIAPGIWALTPIILQVEALLRKGFHPFDFPLKETKDPLSLYSPARLPEQVFSRPPSD